jgi:outer membrane protein OmpA-like peptidoglycan-associated protein
MKYFRLFTILLAVSAVSSCSTKYFLKKGDTSYDNLAYADATGSYMKAYGKDTSYQAVSGLANSYRMMNDAGMAMAYYLKALKYPESKPEDLFNLGKLFMQHGMYPDARVCFSDYLRKVGDDVVAEMLLASCNSVNRFMEDTTLYTLKHVKTEGVTNSFSQQPYAGGLVFSADRPEFKGKNKNPWTGNSYQDLYFTQKDEQGRWISPVLLKGEINGQYHEGPASFSADGNTVYFTRSDYVKRKAGKNSENVNNLKIFRATLKGDQWVDLVPMSFNSDEHSVGHPSLSADGHTLYFVSDAPGGYGGTDIYRVKKDGSEWGIPENLGKEVNTPGNEMFPYIHQDGTLYFSSDAHNNMGGLDVFMTTEIDGKWLQVENLNYPLNSSRDDFAYVVNKDSQTGFVSSNRTSKDQIYEFKKNDPTFTLSGVVYESGNDSKVIADARIELLDLNSGEVLVAISNEKGMYQIGLKPFTNYLIKAVKTLHFADVDSVSTTGFKTSQNLTRDFHLTPYVIEKPIVLDNIYYDLDKWFIREDAARELDKLVKILKDNPEISIELSSHTDSRASDHYNLVLSDKRAKAAVDYIASCGIDIERMTWKGYGETKLVNQCKNQVKCSEEEHQQNRRTEFKVIKIAQ